MKWAIGIEYCGTAFCGWQRQGPLRTVQAVMEHAMERVASEPVRLQCAGRTDTGVHATWQVAHFESSAVRPLRAWVAGVNAGTDADVAVHWVREVTSDFHARYSAESRSYRYVILNRAARPGLFQGRVAWEPRPLAIEPMRTAAAYLVGAHDFSSFRAQGCQARHPCRTIHHVSLWRQGELICLEVTANAFLQRMVRNIVGALCLVGLSRRPPDWLADVLADRKRPYDMPCAVATGLYLIDVRYPSRFDLPASADHSADQPLLFAKAVD